MEIAKIISIPPDKQIELKIGGLFYQRLNKLIIEYVAMKDEEELIIAVSKIRNNQAQTDDFAYNVETLMILIRDIEEAFKAAGFTETHDIEYEPNKAYQDVTHNEH